MTARLDTPIAERIKRASAGLRGAIGRELERPAEPFSAASAGLLKFHGVYQQQDRDQRRNGDGAIERPCDFMLRIKVPAGKLTSVQWKAVLDTAQDFAAGGVQLTSRQAVQIRGVKKSDLGEALRRMAGVGLTTLGGGGDLNCNVMCCPPSWLDPDAASEMDALADSLSQAMLPEDDGYRETWRIGDAPGGVACASHGDGAGDVPSHSPPRFPYGTTYLPHKFKIGLACEDDNCTDAMVQDIGLVAVLERGRIVGYNVVIGGGLGHVPGLPASFPRLATPLAFVAKRDALRVVFAIAKLYRDHGNRSRRYRARLKYLVHDWGIARIRRRLEDDLGAWLAWPRPLAITGREDHRGWRQRGDGRWMLGVHVVDGSIEDRLGITLSTAVRRLIDVPGVSLRVSPQRRLLVTGVPTEGRAAIAAILAECGVASLHDVKALRGCSDACAGLPYCGRAITESHRLMPRLLAELETVLVRLELADEPICLRLVGCPAGCTRSYLAEIAVVGRTVDARTLQGKYAIYVGGDRFGRRLASLYEDLVLENDIVPVLAPLLVFFRRDGIDGESFGDFCHRQGVRALHDFAQACRFDWPSPQTEFGV